MKRVAKLLLLIGLGVLLLVGCGQAENNKNEVQTVNIVVDDWGFTPNVIEAKKGEIKLVLENKGKRMHGFGIEEIDLDIRVAPGQTTEKVINIEESGEYDFVCTVLCGTMQQHEGMQGKLIIK